MVGDRWWERKGGRMGDRWWEMDGAIMVREEKVILEEREANEGKEERLEIWK